MDSKPLYRVGAAGLDPRDWRLIEIVFKHSQYNKYEFQLVAEVTPESIDILIVNNVEPEGLKALSIMRSGARSVPVIAAVPRGAPSSAKHAISIDRLTLQLLPILNRVVDIELQGNPAPEEAGAPAAADAATNTPAAAAESGGSAASLARGSQAGAVPAQLETATAGIPAAAAGAARVTAPQPPAASAVPGHREQEMRESGNRESDIRDTGARQAPADARAPSPGRTTGERTSAERTHAERTQAPAEGTTRTRGMDRPASASNLVSFPLGNQVEALPMQRLRVLVVDDSPTVRQQLSIAFERMGMLCEAVASAALALERLASVHFDLALVDVIMPEMDGYKLTREIKRNRRHRQLPVIILTSKSSPFDLARGALAGCDTYLTKPVPLKALEAAVVKQLRKSLAIDDLSALVRTSDQPGSGSASASAAAAAARNAARS